MKTINELLLAACKNNTTRADYDRIAAELIAAGQKDSSRTGLTGQIIGAAIAGSASPVAGVMGAETTGITRANDVACALHNALNRIYRRANA